jgi:hypothetical protein
LQWYTALWLYAEERQIQVPISIAQKKQKHTNPKRTMDALLAFLGVRTCDVVSYKRADLGQQQVERRFSAHLKAFMMR